MHFPSYVKREAENVKGRGGKGIGVEVFSSEIASSKEMRNMRQSDALRSVFLTRLASLKVLKPLLQSVADKSVQLDLHGRMCVQ